MIAISCAVRNDRERRKQHTHTRTHAYKILCQQTIIHTDTHTRADNNDDDDDGGVVATEFVRTAVRIALLLHYSVLIMCTALYVN